jgi:cytochrome c2
MNGMRVAALALGLVAVGVPRAVQAQAPQAKTVITVDENLAKKGKSLFTNRGCNGCHTIGKGQLAGPDLALALDRRDLEWLKKWLSDTNNMLDNDPIAQEMLKEYKNVRMPDMKLKPDEVDGLLHFIAQEKAKQKK